MSELTLDRSAIAQAAEKIRSISPKFAKFSEHVGVSMRSSYIALYNAISSADVEESATILDRIRSSDLVKGISGKLHDLREEIDGLREALSPWIGTIGGIVVALGALWGSATLGPILAGLIAIAGFLYAINSASTYILSKGMKAAAS